MRSSQWLAVLTLRRQVRGIPASRASSRADSAPPMAALVPSILRVRVRRGNGQEGASKGHVEQPIAHLPDARTRRGETLIQEPEALAELQRLADRLAATSIDVDIEISTTLFGSPAEVIVKTARRHLAEIIVMSTHGRSGLGRWLYGSVAEEVLRLAPVPVLLVPATSERAWPTQRPPRVLLALDGSPLAAEAIEPARTWAQALGAEVVLVRVLPPRSAEAAAYVYEDPLAEQTDALQALESAAASIRELGINVSLHTGWRCRPSDHGPCAGAGRRRDCHGHHRPLRPQPGRARQRSDRDAPPPGLADVCRPSSTARTHAVAGTRRRPNNCTQCADDPARTA
jgi:nucleotide-binding universal stress UspA family protein